MQENPRFQSPTIGQANPEIPPQPTPTGSPTQAPSTGLQAQQTPPIGQLAAQIANLEARQSSLEAQQAQQGTGPVQATTPSLVAQQTTPTMQPTSPQQRPTPPPTATGAQQPSGRPHQAGAQEPGREQSLAEGFRSMTGNPMLGSRRQQSQAQQFPQVQPWIQQPRSPMQAQPGQGPTRGHQPQGMQRPMMQQQPHHAQFGGASPQRPMGSQGPGMQWVGGQGGQLGSQAGPQARQRQIRQPPVDILDEGEYLVLEIELPGARKDDIRLTGQSNVIELNAPTEEHREEKNLLRSERGQVFYRRSIPLGVEVDSEEIEARFEDGILRVKAPKRDPKSGPQRIEVN